MLNLSSQEIEQISSEESEEVIPGTNYTRKIKKVSKRLNKIFGGNKRKKCQNYDKGTCQRGRNCTESHSFVPDIAKARKSAFLTLGDHVIWDPVAFIHTIQNAIPAESIISQKNAQTELIQDVDQEYLKQNEDYLLQLYSKNTRSLQKKFITYINNMSKNHDKNKIQQYQNILSQLPQCFWLPVKKTALIVQNNQQRSRPLMKRGRKRKSEIQKIQQPLRVKGIFSVRFNTKNRKQIPQKLQDELILKYSKIYRTDKLNEECQKNSQETYPKGQNQKIKNNINQVDEYLA